MRLLLRHAPALARGHCPRLPLRFLRIVVLKETGVGIPDLLIVVYDVDPQTEPEEVSVGEAGPVGGNGEEAATTSSAASVSVAARKWGAPIGDRLGSRLTALDGSFRFDYEDEEFRRGFVIDSANVRIVEHADQGNGD